MASQALIVFSLFSLCARLVSALADTQLCGQYQNVTDASKIYSFSTNVWGNDSSGASCIEVANNATTLTTTWSWKANQTLVHAYPNINFNPIQKDPIPISNLNSMDINVGWFMKPTTSPSTAAFDASGLTIVDAMANVALDVFFDADASRAVNTTAPRYEFMVWFGTFGGILPVGSEDNPKNLPTQKIGKNTFTLYQGSNNVGQYVYSWVANTNLTEFTGDVSPLLHYLWRHGLVLSSNYIGVIELGTEQKHATSNVTFGFNNFNISTVKGAPKDAGADIHTASRWTFAVVLVAMVLLW